MDSVTFDAMERVSWDPPLQEENLNRPQARDSSHESARHVQQRS
jgi:hypothetical protein